MRRWQVCIMRAPLVVTTLGGAMSRLHSSDESSRNGGNNNQNVSWSYVECRRTHDFQRVGGTSKDHEHKIHLCTDSRWLPITPSFSSSSSSSSSASLSSPSSP